MQQIRGVAKIYPKNILNFSNTFTGNMLTTLTKSIG